MSGRSPSSLAISASSRCSSAELGRRVELDPLRLAERALGEGREPADRLDLVAEQLQARGALLGRREDVEDPAADRELAAVLDLLGALVARLGEQLGDVAEVDLLAAVQRRSPRGAARRRGPPRRGRRRWRRRPAARRSRLAVGERVERADPQADEVRRRGEVGLVAGAARGVVADAPRRQVGAELAGEVAGARRRRRRRRAPAGRRAPRRNRAGRRAGRAGSPRKRAGRPPRRRGSGPRGRRCARLRARGRAALAATAREVSDAIAARRRPADASVPVGKPGPGAPVDLALALVAGAVLDPVQLVQHPLQPRDRLGRMLGHLGGELQRRLLGPRPPGRPCARGPSGRPCRRRPPSRSAAGTWRPRGRRG